MANLKSTAPVKITLVLFVGLICTFLFLRGSFFNIRQVTVSGNQHVDAATLIDLARVPWETNIFMADLKYIALAAESHPLVKRVEPVRRLPRTLELAVTEREAWAYIPVADGLIVVDQDGVYLDKLNYIQDSSMPLITLDTMPPLVVGQVVHAQAAASVAEVHSQLETGIAAGVSEYHYDSGTGFLTLYTVKGTEIRFGSPYERLTDKLPMISRTLTLEQEMAAEGRESLVYVDIRYSGAPVIQTK
jgi:cell division protein FtsQ